MGVVVLSPLVIQHIALNPSCCVAIHGEVLLQKNLEVHFNFLLRFISEDLGLDFSENVESVDCPLLELVERDFLCRRTVIEIESMRILIPFVCVPCPLLSRIEPSIAMHRSRVESRRCSMLVGLIFRHTHLATMSFSRQAGARRSSLPE